MRLGKDLRHATYLAEKQSSCTKAKHGHTIQAAETPCAGRTRGKTLAKQHAPGTKHGNAFSREIATHPGGEQRAEVVLVGVAVAPDVVAPLHVAVLSEYVRHFAIVRDDVRMIAPQHRPLAALAPV